MSKFENFRKIECSIILVDISGFTQLLYQANFREHIMESVIDVVHSMFKASIEFDDSDDNSMIINTTGDGFFAIAKGPDSCKLAIDYARNIREIFNEKILSVTESLAFRQTLDLRVALHYGTIYQLDVSRKTLGYYPIYIGDDLNLTSRLIDCNTAKKYNIAMSKQFYKKYLSDKDCEPEEILFDKNLYPEKIEVYRMK